MPQTAGKKQVLTVGSKPLRAVSSAIGARSPGQTSVSHAVVTEPSDDRLMRSFCRGNQRAFDELYARYKQPLHNYMQRNCRVEHIAGELYQDVWLRVISSAKNYTKKGKFRAWIFTLAHNRLVDYYRKAEHQYAKDPETENLTGQSNPEQAVISDETRRTLDEMVRTLPFEQQQAFYLREESGFSIREIAEIQGISKEAAKSRLRYAYAKLRLVISETELVDQNKIKIAKEQNNET